jgi:hypothetical protein
VPTPVGSGRWQVGILGTLDGIPAELNDLVREMLGREPTPAEYTAAHRAARLLAARGQVRASLEHTSGQGHRVLVLLKIGNHVRDHDGARGADAEAQPRDWRTERCDRAWQAFAADPGYAEEIARAGRKLGRLVRDRDGAEGMEVRRYTMGVADIGARDPGQIGEAASRHQFPTAR